MRIIEDNIRTIVVPDTKTLKGCSLTMNTHIKVGRLMELERWPSKAEAQIQLILDTVKAWDGFDLPLTKDGIAELGLGDLNQISELVGDAIRNP